jgi:hypothetical protein
MPALLDCRAAAVLAWNVPALSHLSYALLDCEALLLRTTQHSSRSSDPASTPTVAACSTCQTAGILPGEPSGLRGAYKLAVLLPRVPWALLEGSVAPPAPPLCARATVGVLPKGSQRGQVGRSAEEAMKRAAHACAAMHAELMGSQDVLAEGGASKLPVEAFAEAFAAALAPAASILDAMAQPCEAARPAQSSAAAAQALGHASAVLEWLAAATAHACMAPQLAKSAPAVAAAAEELLEASCAGCAVRASQQLALAAARAAELACEASEQSVSSGADGDGEPAAIPGAVSMAGPGCWHLTLQLAEAAARAERLLGGLGVGASL